MEFWIQVEINLLVISNTQDIVKNQQNVTSKWMADCHCRLLSNWLRNKNELRRIEYNKPEKLNTCLAKFVLLFGMQMKICHWMILADNMSPVHFCLCIHCFIDF